MSVRAFNLQQDRLRGVLGGYEGFYNANGVNSSCFWFDEGTALQSKRSLCFVLGNHHPIQPDIDRSNPIRKVLKAKQYPALESVEALDGQGHLSLAFRGDAYLALLDGNFDVWLGHQCNHFQKIAAIRYSLSDFAAQPRSPQDAIANPFFRQAHAGFERQQQGNRSFA